MTTSDVAWTLAIAALALVAIAAWLARRARAASNAYDVVVLGGGAAGLTAAGMSAQLGARTLLVEREKLGGDCTWTGCIPSKALLSAAKVAQHARGAARHGLVPAELGVDLSKVLGRVRAIQQHVYDDADSPEVVASFGVEVRRADARFTGPNEVALTADGVTTYVRFRRAIIATGSAPAIPTIAGLDAASFLTNETLFRLERLPAHLVVIGGGPIGIEMAQAFRRLGSRVTVLERAAEILARDDRELAALLRERLEAEGVRVVCGAEVTRVERAGGGDVNSVHIAFQVDGATETIAADELLVATGRRARTALGLDAAGVRATERGIAIDARCRTSQRHIYACGDVTGELQLTHMAEHMAKVAVTNAVIGLPMSIDRAGATWVTFTDPELAHVGARREDLDRAGTRYRLYRFPFAKIDRAVAESAKHGWVHVLATPLRGRILGATILGEGAGEMIAELALARKHGISLRQIADTIHPYPTLALGNRRVADQWYVQRASPLLVRVLRALRGLRGAVPPPPDPNRVV